MEIGALELKTLFDAQSNRSHEEDHYDIAIVGSGLSCAFTLIHYVSLLELNAPRKPVRVIVVEKSGELWTGIPYGNRTGRHALLISSLKEHVLEQSEREQFAAWLNRNSNRLFDAGDRNDGELSANWRRRHEVAIAEGRWDDIFIPRHAFGLYLQERLASLLQEAAKKDLLTVCVMAAEVVDIQPIDDLHRIDVVRTSEGSASIRASKVILTIGSPPNQVFGPSQPNAAENNLCYIDSMYEPSMDSNIHRICEFIRQSGNAARSQVLIIGSKTSALDVLYCLSNSNEATDLITKFTLLSPSAALPYRLSCEGPRASFYPKHLATLANSKSFTARQILNAVRRDLAYAASQNVNIADVHADISRGMVDALNRLSFIEQKAFVSKYGNEIGRIQRRVGAESLNVVDGLISQGRLELLKGKFARFLSLPEGGHGCEYVVNTNRGRKVLIAQAGIVINCAGFRDVTQSPTSLIQNLIRRGLCVPDPSKRGFIVSENFETSKNCYLMGPLLAGNINGKIRVWQAESCSRIIDMSRQLAQVLAQN